MVISLEIVKVRNGYLVRQGENPSIERPGIDKAYVFNSWEDCSAHALTILEETSNVRR